MTATPAPAPLPPALLAQAMETADASTSIAHCVPVASLAEQNYALAAAQVSMGATETAMGFLRRAVDSGWRDGRWLRRDPLLASMQGLAGFAELMECLGGFRLVAFDEG